MKIKILVVTIVAFILSGCGSTAPWITPPGTGYEVTNSKSFDKSYDEVWGNILGFLSKNGALIKGIDKDNGLITAELASFEDDLADCGSDSSMKTIERRASLNIVVSRNSGMVTVSINNEFIESRQMMQAFEKVACNSKGVVESRILNAADE